MTSQTFPAFGCKSLIKTFITSWELILLTSSLTFFTSFIYFIFFLVFSILKIFFSIIFLLIHYNFHYYFNFSIQNQFLIVILVLQSYFNILTVFNCLF